MRARLFAAFLLIAAVPAFAAIRGTVMSIDGQPLSGAKVSAFSIERAEDRRARLVSATPERTAIASTSTDSKGAFVLDSPKDPVIALQIDAKGYVPEGIRVERDEDTIVVALRAAAAKQGSVAANGKPLAGATLAWEGNGVEIVVKTDAGGKYSVPDPSRWGGGVTIIHPDFAISEEVFGMQRKTDVNFSLDAGTALGGVVRKGTAPVAKAAILVDGWALATSSDDGSFAIAHAPKKWELIEARTADAIATHGRAAGAVTLKVAAAASISGVVRDTKTKQPVAGTEVALERPMGRARRTAASANADAIASAITDAKGAFSAMVRPGVYQIASSHPSYSVESMNVSATVGQRVQKALAATAMARITGTVIDEQKRGIAAVNVTSEPTSDGMQGMRRLMMAGRNGVFSGPDGRFSIRTADSGDVQLVASKKGLPGGKSATLRIASGERKSGVTITMPHGVALAGRVVDRDGKPLSGVSITTIEGESAGGRPGGPMIRRMILGMAAPDADAVTTASDGTFSIRLKEGTYDVKFAREGFAAKVLRGQQVSPSSKPVEVTLEPGVEISGRVVRSGVGVEGVNVSTLDMETRSFATTSSDGRFVLTDLTPGTLMVNFGKQDEFIQLTRSMTAPSRDLTIEIPAGGRISGHVVDKASHEPVTAFQAGIDPSRSGGGMVMRFTPALRGFTTDDGNFVLENVPPGPVQVVVSAPGFTTARVPTVTVEEGKTAEVEVALESGVRLAGHVSGPDGTPLSGVSVRPGGDGGFRVPGIAAGAAAVTDANGDYSIDQLEAGDNKSFVFSRSGFLVEQRTVNLSGKETRLDVQLSAGLTISGQVVTEGGVPVPDADVRAMSAAAGSSGKAARTDASGGFVFDAMAPARYTFMASKAGYADGMLRDFDVSAGGSPSIVLKSGGTLTGHISGVSDADLSRVTVTARTSSGSTDAVVDSAGNYRMDGTPTGTLRVTASLMRGFGDVRTTDMKSVDVAPGGAAQLDLVFASDTVIRGHVTRNGAPAANSTIQFGPRTAGVQTRASATTDDGGNYSVTGLAEGDYGVVVIDMQRLNPYSTTYSVHGSASFDIDIKTATLHGHVIDRGDSTPISGARIEIRRSDAQNAFIAQGATSDDSGGFVVDGIAAGTYTISAEKDGYGNVVKDISVSDSAPQDVMLDLVRNDGVTLKVVDGRDGRALNAIITVFDAQNRTVYQSGRFGSSDSQPMPLAAGQYRAVVAANGYAPKTVSFMSPSTQTVALTPGGTLVIRSRSAVVQRAILLDAGGSPYLRPFVTDPSLALVPGETRLQNIAAGSYTLQILGPNGAVAATQTVVVVEGQEVAVDV